MSDLDTYMKSYSSAMDCRSEQQRTTAREIQQRVKRTLEQKVRMEKITNRYSNKFSSN
jgi:hypothetical protein